MSSTSTHAPAPASVTPWILRPATLLRVALALTFLVYLRTIAFDFVFDDHLQIALNEWLDSWRLVPMYFTHQLWGFTGFSSSANFYRPLFLVWLAAIKHLTGGAPGWYHLLTIVLHMGVVVEAFVLARMLLRDSTGAAIAAALFALHPAKVETVAWIAGGGEPLFAAFFFATFIFYLRSRLSSASRIWLAAALGCFALALFSKEQAIVLPGILAAYMWSKSADQRFSQRCRTVVVSLVPFIIVAALFWVMRSHVMHGLAESAPRISATKTLLTQPLTWLFYLRHLLFPFGQSIFYSPMIVRQFSVQWVLLPSLLLLAIATAVWHFAHKTTEGIMLMAWFVLTLAPAAAMVLLIQPHDRYLYLPSFAACVGAATLIRQHLDNQRLQAAVVTGLLLIFATSTFHETRYWDNDISLFERAVAVAPDNAPVRVMLASSYTLQGDAERGMATLREATRRNPEEFNGWQALGIQEYTFGRYQDAYNDLLHGVATAAYPKQGSVCMYHLALTSQKLGNNSEAEQWMRRAVAADPGSAGYHAGLAAILEAERRHEEAQQERDIAQRIRQSFAH